MRWPKLSRDRFPGTLVFVFLIVLGSFLATTIAIQRFSIEIDTLSGAIASESTPRIERLANVRGSALELELALSAYLHAPAGLRGDRARRVERALEQLAEHVQRYHDLPPLAGEGEHFRQLQRSWAALDRAARRVRERADEGQAEVSAIAVSIDPAVNRLDRAAMTAIELNAQNTRAMAARIQEVRRRTLLLSGGLTALCLALGLAGAISIQRQARRRRAEAEERSRLLEARARDLEQFAGRVAHDIKNPLSAAKMAVDALLLRVEDERQRKLGERVARGLDRTDAIITDLLDFARAGSRPDPGARTSPQAVLSDMAPAIVEDAARAGIEVDLEPAPPLLVSCNPGVYMSLVGNLLRNAVKYMGDAEERRITVRVLDRGESVRTEVSDTGPGIDERDQHALFEPYFRGSARHRDGLGLGLATVKRLVEGHDGKLGLESQPGRGSTFWFELPRAGVAWQDEPADAASAENAHWHH